MQHGLSPEDVEWLRDGYRMFREGDPSFMDRYAADARFDFPATLPAGGTYSGPMEALEFWTTIAELFENPHPEPEEFLRADDRVIVLGTWRGRSRQTGEEIALRFAHVLRLEGNPASLIGAKAVSFELVVDTAAMLRALGLAPG